MGEADRELRSERLPAAARATAERLSLEVMVTQLTELYASLAERAP